VWEKWGDMNIQNKCVKNPVTAALKSLFGNEFGSVTVNEAPSSKTKSN
jgi:hypothetical protein